MNRTMMLAVAAVVMVLAIGGVVIFGREKTAAPTTSTQSTQPTSGSSSANMEETQPSASSTTPAPNATAQTNTAKVEIKDFAYSPATLTVKKGTAVTWANQDSVGHTVTADNGGEPDSASFAQGQSFTYTFNTVGTFKYHCKPHPQMQATVVVTD